MLSHINTDTNAEIFSALSDPTRMSITEMLANNGKMSAGDISAEFDVSFPAISQHLKVLKDAQVVRMEKQAQKRLYAINPESFTELETWIQKIKNTWEARFNQLDELLTNQKGGSQ